MNGLRRTAPLFLSLCFAVAFACLPGLQSHAAEALESSADAPVLLGTVLGVTDGDTIRVRLDSGPITVRLDSIDAPEKNQPWGREAYAALYGRLRQQVVALDVREQDRYERLVAVVYLGDENINAWLVREGHAWAYRRYLRDPAYCRWEDAARSAHRGLWSLPEANWLAPWEWRRAERGQAMRHTNYARETAEHCMSTAGQFKK